VGKYRDDLDAAHQRIAALVGELAEKGAPAAPDAAPRGAPDALPKAASAAMREAHAYANGTAIPPRLRWISRLTALGFLAAHAAVAAAVVAPHLDGWVVFGVVGFLVPLPLALTAGRFARAIVDPSVGHYDRGDPENGRGPSVVRYARPTAAAVCALVVVAEAAWVGWALPALQHAGRRPCPRCQMDGASPR
jgi:hypothetical protein